MVFNKVDQEKKAMILEEWNPILNLPKIVDCGEEPLWDPVQPMLTWKRMQNDDDDHYK